MVSVLEVGQEKETDILELNIFWFVITHVIIFHNLLVGVRLQEIKELLVV